ncbi:MULTISPECIES: SAM hydrolase/SAM-dependent halogenase family protein [Maribacter]|uniref:SAM-dependent chlorinase/fluorinase n=1 Tax=Maribacter flavus TaxID=1658664 RepID=A0ABU7IJB2_9FLAO|nr:MULTISPECIES: SAM-dependent chlorinase/fluorinase [Maribacter]MDC6405743.1 SAM-dependent chlorinase/fluorinase [Maribacter sp. PR66]MEE1973005.1 SAM-dependent chlorinase/fluorinase [Maribacter flavus]
MAIITLTTDFGLKDHFVGVLKGSIYSELPDAKIVDISHDVAPFNIQECAYILKNSYNSFPKGSIHIVGVDSEATQENQHIVVLINGHYFVSANTGVIGLITSEIKPDKIVEINIPDSLHGSFPVLSVFVQVACHIARGGTLEVVGKPFNDLKDLREFMPRIVDDGKKIIGSVIYIDNYGNVVTNIQKHLFEAYRKGRDFELLVRNHKIKKIHKAYNDIIDFSIEKSKRKGDGDLLALFNSSDYIELAIYKSNLKTVGGASTLLGLDYRDTIMIDFL